MVKYLFSPLFFNLAFMTLHVTSKVKCQLMRGVTFCDPIVELKVKLCICSKFSKIIKCFVI